MRWSDTNTAQITPTIFAELYDGPPRGCAFVPDGWDDYWNIAITDSETPQRGTMLTRLNLRAKTRTEARAKAGGVIAAWLREVADSLETAAGACASGNRLLRQSDVIAWLTAKLDEADGRCEAIGVLDVYRDLLDDVQNGP